MRKSVTAVLVVATLVLGLVGSASAFEICFNISGFGSLFKFEMRLVGQFLQLTGQERQFEERVLFGTAYATPNNRIRMGFTQVANNAAGVTDIIWNVDLDRATLSGPGTGWRISFNDMISGTVAAIACAPTLGNGLPDPASP